MSDRVEHVGLVHECELVYLLNHMLLNDIRNDPFGILVIFDLDLVVVSCDDFSNTCGLLLNGLLTDEHFWRDVYYLLICEIEFN